MRNMLYQACLCTTSEAISYRLTVQTFCSGQGADSPLSPAPPGQRPRGLPRSPISETADREIAGDAREGPEAGAPYRAIEQRARSNGVAKPTSQMRIRYVEQTTAEQNWAQAQDVPLLQAPRTRSPAHLRLPHFRMHSRRRVDAQVDRIALHAIEHGDHPRRQRPAPHSR